jgi:flagellar biosynthesis protein FliR
VLATLTSYIFVLFLTALGVGGGAILVLFLTDLVIALLSRTVPQMNALLLGIQVKSLLLLFILPIVFSLSAVLLTQMITAALGVMPRLL